MIKKYTIYILTALLFSGNSAAQSLLGNTVERTGELHYINVAERRVVIDDHNFKLSPSARLTSAITRSSVGKKVRYTLVGRSGGNQGLIVHIARASAKNENSRNE